MTPELQNQSEWKDWFALPYIKAAEENPAFSTYFTRQWQDIFWLSLHNFLAAIFQALPKPQLMQYEAEQQRFKELLDENARLREQLAAAVSGEQTAGAAKSKQEKMEDEDFISTGSDLMDDFFCIARESPPSSASESKGIKSFIKNISLPSVSPTLSKKPTPLTTVAVSQTQPTTTQSQIPKRTLATSPSDERSSLSTAANGKVNSRGSQLQQPPSRQRSRHITPTGSIAKPSPIASGNSPRSEQVAPSERSKQQRLQQERQDMERQRQELLSNSSEATKLKTNAKEEIKSPTSPPPEISENSMGEEEESKEAPPFLLLSQDEYREHQSAIVHCRFSPLAGMVASCDLDGIVKVWSVSPVPSTVVVVMTKSPLQTLEWSGKMDRYLLLGSRMGTVRMFDTVEKKNLNEIIVDQSFPRVLSIASSPSGASFVCSCAAKPSTELQWDQCKGRMYVCSTKNMKIERLLPLDSDDRCVNCTAFNHNGNLLVTGSTGGVISLYDMQRNESIASWKAHQGQVHSVRFSEDENSCYSMGSDGKFVQWSLLKRSGRRLVELGIHNGATGPFNAVGMGGKQQSFTPRGNLFSFDSTGKHVLTCAPSGGLIYKVCIAHV
ncbi:PREDICTED: WD repeat-containing protein 91-like isoform X2 [Priapulus caudatus]|nr:PREDICTED: WD repeat-containing protein 91-like isoform X2 [Priapulus caudatus]